ncbi:MAG: biotin transporter BioY [Tissierellia bacterium]|nr:biotin transporter BioY [Tissierellia bacterium]
MEGTRRISTAMIVKISLFVALIAIGAFIKVPIPNMVFTLQFLFTNLAGLLLGPYYGALAVGLYVLLGLLGVPIFTAPAGPSYIFYPTFGYLIGFIVGAFAGGMIIQKSSKPGIKTYVFAGLLNLFFVYLFGVIYYYMIVNYITHNAMSFKVVLYWCLLLPIPGDLLLTYIAAIIAKRVHIGLGEYQ